MCNDGERERERERESERESIPVLPFSHLLQYLTYGIQRQWFTNCVSELWKLILCALPIVYQRCLGYFHRDKCCLKHCAVGSSRKVWLPLVGSTFICVGVYLNIAITMLIKLTIYIYIYIYKKTFIYTQGQTSTPAYHLSMQTPRLRHISLFNTSYRLHHTSYINIKSVCTLWFGYSSKVS